MNHNANTFVETLCTVAVVSGMFAHNIWATEIQTEDVGGLTWQFTIEDGKARIYGGMLKSAIGMTSGHVDVPDRLGNCPVKTIGSYAFNQQQGVVSISIPEGVEEIEFYACRGCTGLKSISMPSTIMAMGNAVFTGCTNLVAGVIPDSVTTMGRDMFYNCKSMTSVKFSRNVKSLGAMTCYQCDSLTNVEIPYGVTNIGASAFSNCDNLTTVTIPDTVESIENSAFNNCPNLEPFDLPAGLKTLNPIFNNCPKIKTVTIPMATETIDSYAFVGDYNRIDVDPGNRNFKSVNGVLYSEDGSSLVAWPRGIIPIVIPLGTTRIAERAFMNNTSAFALELPMGLSRIDNWAFSGCTGLSSISLPSSMTEIGDGAFRGCSSMVSATFANGIRTIGCEAFKDCTRLDELVLPPSVTLIATNSFRGCTSLASARIEAEHAEIQAWAFYGCSALRSLYLSDGIWHVGDRAFDSAQLENGLVVRGTAIVGFANSHASAVKITEGITDVESGVFDDYPFTEVYMPASMKRIASCAFKHCNNLKRITLHPNLNNIAEDAFYQCPNIEEIRIVDGTITNAVPLSWTSYYPRFEQLYGNNLILALICPSGKSSSDGNPMYVWQDYVAGTDPTSPTDVFTVSIRMDGTMPRLEWHPDLRTGDVLLGMRTYVVYASTNLVDWTETRESDLDKYKFFKIGVRPVE